MTIMRRNPRNFDPSQLASLSGSGAVDYSVFEEENPTAEAPRRRYRISSEFSLSERPTESTTFPSEMEDSEEISKIIKQKEEVIHLKPVADIRSRFLELQKWEGIVTEVSKDSFVGRLIDLTERSGDTEAEFSIEEVHQEDKPLVEVGAVFYWTIGYKEDRGQRIRASMIRFRRLPAWQKEEIEAAKRDAKYIKDLFQWH